MAKTHHRTHTEHSRKGHTTEVHHHHHVHHEHHVHGGGKGAPKMAAKKSPKPKK